MAIDKVTLVTDCVQVKKSPCDILLHGVTWMSEGTVRGNCVLWMTAGVRRLLVNWSCETFYSEDIWAIKKSTISATKRIRSEKYTYTKLLNLHSAWDLVKSNEQVAMETSLTLFPLAYSFLHFTFLNWNILLRLTKGNHSNSFSREVFFLCVCVWDELTKNKLSK